MWKMMALVVATASLVQTTNAAGKQRPAAQAAVFLEGTLQYDDGSGPHIREAGAWVGPFLIINGEWYGLDLGKDKALAEKTGKLHGKRVRATGTLTIRDLPGGLPGFSPRRVLLVEKLEPAPGKEDSAWTVIQGKFKSRERFGYPATREAAALTTKGQTYILDFGTNEELRQRALKFDGKALRLRGTLAGWESFTTMCVPWAGRVPVIRVTSIEDDGNKGP